MLDCHAIKSWEGYAMKRKLSTSLALLIILVLCISAVACAKKDDHEKVKIKTAGDIKTLNISVQKGTEGEYLVLDLVGEGNEKQVHSYEKYADAILALKQKKVDATLMDEGPAKRFIEKNSELMILPGDYETEAYALGIKKGNVALLEKINPLIESMKKDGVLDDIVAKYSEGDDFKAADIDMNKGAKNGKLVMGTEAGFPPYEMKVSDGIVGVDLEICAYLAKHLDMELVIEEMNFDSLIGAVDSGRIDVIAAGLTVKEERKENIDFSIPYFDNARQIFVIRASSFEE